MKPTQHIPAAVYWLVIALAILWGTSWPLMKLALVEMQPLRFRVFCVAVGGFGLLAVCWAMKAPLLVSRQVFLKIAGVSLFSAVAWSLCMSYGLRMMESSRAVIIAYMFPVWSVPLSAWLLHEPLTQRRMVGLVAGLVGLALLMGDEIYAVGRSPVGALLMFGTATSWAISTILAKKWVVPVPSCTFAAWVNLSALMVLLPLSLFIEEGPFHPFGFSTGPMIGALYASIVASLICQWIWFRLVAITTASVASISILSVPIVGVFSGLALLGEQPRLTDLLALFLVVVALASVMLPGKTAAAKT
ncbi:MAG: DMT family transporter [Burkholderiales bacterium]